MSSGLALVAWDICIAPHGSCGDGRPREPALSEVEGSKPSAARQPSVVAATLDSP